MTKKINTKFFNFSQNNSGGYFVTDLKNGVCEEVIIEAKSALEAIKKLNKIGDKVDGFHEYCSCCGERWSDYLNDDDGKNEPMIYDTPIKDYKKSMFRNGAFVHYKDGTFKYFKHK